MSSNTENEIEKVAVEGEIAVKTLWQEVEAFFASIGNKLAGDATNKLTALSGIKEACHSVLETTPPVEATPTPSPVAAAEVKADSAAEAGAEEEAANTNEPKADSAP